MRLSKTVLLLAVVFSSVAFAQTPPASPAPSVPSAPPTKPPFTLSPQTTVISAPLNPDGSPVKITDDYLGKARNVENPFPGPFEIVNNGRQTFKVWPK